MSPFCQDRASLSKSRTPAVRTLVMLPMLALALSLAACSNAVNDYATDNYASWEGNVRDEYVLDALGREFAVLKKDRAVVATHDDDLLLRDLRVGEDAIVRDHGTAIGNVTLIPYNNATYVAAFVCTNGTRMRIDTSRSTYPTGTWRILNC